jgi:hypothetical protein
MRSLSRRAAAVAAFLAATSLYGQSKPDFSGTWKLNKAKSDLGMMADRVPEDFTVKIDHKEPEIRIAQPGMRGGTQESKVTTDGKPAESTTQGPMGEVKSKAVAKWDGAALTLDVNREMGGNTMSQSDRWTLSEDGKILTIARKMSGPMGEMELKQVLEKQ